MRIVDNFLPSSQFKELQSFMLGDNFPWFFNDHITNPGDGHYQYTHTFYRYDINLASQWHYLIHDCLRKLLPKKIHRIKANLNPQASSHVRGGYHVDFSKKREGFDCTTSILYLNTNNGWTQFKNGDKVDCVENRMVFFKSKLKHEGVGCTDQLRKVVINFNYEKD